MDRDQIFAERLIAYWLGNLPEGDESFLLCRDLSIRLAQMLPSSLLEIMKREPHQHREAIQQMIRPYLPDDMVLYRDFGSRPPVQPSPSPPPAGQFHQAPALPVVTPYRVEPSPEAQDRGSVQNVSGEGNMAINTGGVGGSFHVAAPARRPAASRERPSSGSELRPKPPVRILFVGANPLDSTRLSLDEEVREIDRVLTSASPGARFELHQKWAVRASELQSHLLRIRPQILHFSGHGNRESAILLQGEDGRSRPVAGPVLARVLEQFRHHLQCVVLNACYSEEQARAISQHIDCVVGMSAAVADRAAIRFSALFYESLACGYSVRSAFEMGLSDIELTEMGQMSVPQLVAVRKPPEDLFFAHPAAFSDFQSS